MILVSVSILDEVYEVCFIKKHYSIDPLPVIGERCTLLSWTIKWYKN